MTTYADPRAIARSHSPTESGARFDRDPAHRENLDRLRLLVMSRRSRLRRLLRMRAPEIVVRNEMRMLQVAVATMLEAGRCLDVEARGDVGVLPDRLGRAAIKPRHRSTPIDRREAKRLNTPIGPLSEAGR